ncbi:MAG: anthranilate phosphoribosyltransferase family protein [Drouetiella hepatica Uher 2000/2452]|uniref:Anthranilate phosphoribosyltransferase family protein n=1 Tax=Drouetiella hepatica Uher 2000/2452 TaxID=904376 RepID=A0A951UMS4_9CYAN|nr:anthranilate phosphoribosyltransferase family protein [Drouetiella hepatica Uher 2000/2452]
MSNVFREFLRKVGSGAHTSKDLSRAEADLATQMMLNKEATPAQIGAFMIAHRIKRPTGEELAGMLDAYDALGAKLKPITAAYPTVVMGSPYDGRSRTAPASPLVALILTSAGCPVVLHGGRRMPTKEGLPLIEVWQKLGIDWTELNLEQVQQIFTQTLLGFVYLPHHFGLAEDIVTYREQLGKRPPFATVELFWCPYEGDAIVVSGFVHPPTEEMGRVAAELRGVQRFITVKGLEGSCDLPRDRTCIIGVNDPHTDPTFTRLLLQPRDYGFAATDVPLVSDDRLIEDMKSVLAGVSNPLMESVVWSGGFYLWQGGVCADLEKGLALARELLVSGQASRKLTELREAIASHQDARSILLG